MSVKLPIYLDYNATTPIDPRVLEAMMPYLTERYGNAASRSHSFGTAAAAAVADAREKVAAVIGAGAESIVFTSGATESDNLAIKGTAEAYAAKGKGIITCLAEHKAVLDPCKYLAKHGYDVTWLKPDEYGRVSAEQVEAAMTDQTILISIMAANNEIGTISPIAEIGELAKRRKVIFHCDATQAIGKIPIDVERMGIDLLSLSAHKIYGPKGVGALYVRRSNPRVRPSCQMHGGGHEHGLRSGTLNVPGIVGLGAAAEIAATEMPGESDRLLALRNRLEKGLTQQLDYVKLNGHPTARLPGTANLSFAYVEGESVMLKMKQIAVSSGSACTSASLEPSHVLTAMGVPNDLVHNSIRFSLGRFTKRDEIDYTIEQVVKAVTELRRISPLYDMAMAGVDLGKVQWKEV